MFLLNHMRNTPSMGFDLPVTYRLPALAALLCLAVSGCAATTPGTAMPAERAPLTTADALPDPAAVGR